MIGLFFLSVSDDLKHKPPVEIDQSESDSKSENVVDDDGGPENIQKGEELTCNDATKSTDSDVKDAQREEEDCCDVSGYVTPQEDCDVDQVKHQEPSNTTKEQTTVSTELTEVDSKDVNKVT